MCPAAERKLGTAPLQNAVFCVNCETVSNSPHDACKICGSHSLINVSRMIRGTLWNRDHQFSSTRGKYRLELAAKVREIAATDLNLLLGLVSRLAEAAGRIELNRCISNSNLVMRGY
jgi:hypothetical protein